MSVNNPKIFPVVCLCTRAEVGVMANITSSPCDIKVLLHDVVQILESSEKHLYLLVSTVSIKVI
jgi:hypothetical protein